MRVIKDDKVLNVISKSDNRLILNGYANMYV